MSKIVVKISSTSAVVKGTEAYTWFEYQKSARVHLEFRGKEVEIAKGTVWGYRKTSSSKGSYRVVIDGDLSRVITATHDEVNLLRSRSTPRKGKIVVKPSATDSNNPTIAGWKKVYVPILKTFTETVSKQKGPSKALITYIRGVYEVLEKASRSNLFNTDVGIFKRYAKALASKVDVELKPEKFNKSKDKRAIEAAQRAFKNVLSNKYLLKSIVSKTVTADEPDYINPIYVYAVLGHTKLAYQLAVGDAKQIHIARRSLDTASRDLIPSKVWDLSEELIEDSYANKNSK